MNNTTVEPSPDVVRSNGHGTAVPPLPSLEVIPAEKKTKKRRMVLIASAAILAAVVTSAPAMYSAYVHESTDDAFIDGHIVTVAPKVAGQVAAVYITDNQLVKAGDRLVEIDPRDYQAKVAEHRGKWAAAEAEARRAAADAKRYEQLYKQDGISRQQLDNARAAEVSARGIADKERGALEQEELNLSYAEITAPQAGRITRKAVEAGSYVQTGQALFSIVPEEVWVTANFKETQLTHMQPGQKVSIKVDAYPNRRLEGHIDSIQSGTGQRFSLLPPENATGNYVKVVQRVPVKITLDNASDAKGLVPGMSVVPSVAVR